jgi:2-polyprenyl-3-methyl-5-hydroxy-6-metoxy-1,4-benzoquinol methylase
VSESVVDTSSADTSQDFRTKYTKTNAITRRLLDGFFRAVGESLAGKDIHSALEVGCGEGFSTAKLRDMLPASASIRACDVEQRLVEEARERNPGITIERESIYELPHADASYDVVFVMEVLEHVEDPARGLAEVCRVSKRWVVATVPREPIWRMLNFARLKYVTALGNTPGHLNHWSSGSFRNFVGRSADVRELRKPLPWTVVLAEVRR